MTSVHPTAIVARSADLGQGTVVGPFAVIGEGVIIGEENQVGSHAIIEEGTTMGARNIIHVGACLGTAPQDKKAGVEKTFLVMGDENVIGEHVTLHRGTLHGGGVTTIGNRCVLGPFCHIAHDCLVGDGVNLGAVTGVSGHVTIGPGAETAPHVGVHQFVRLGAWSRCMDFSGINKDIAPFCQTSGNPADTIVLREDLAERLGLEASQIQALLEALALLAQVAPLAGILEQLAQRPSTPQLQILTSFLEEKDHRFPDQRRGMVRRAGA